MAWWPFKKTDEPAAELTAEETLGGQEAPEEATELAPTPTHDALSGDTGPFDGDTVDIEEFDFTDFSNGILNLGSMRLPLPKKSQVQLEMGDNGPRMLHIVTEFGRITPVAFAAPRDSGQWDQALGEIKESMESEGLEVEFLTGPWGRELIGTGDHGAVMRMLGVDGPRWMLRFTMVGPTEKAEELAELGRELAARTFVYRGSEAILAGNSLPIALPQPLVDQVSEVMKNRQSPTVES
ncbi:DUF3710 domain-containing protein [Corynebacterium caspium]|uniref:DUF3710 domain-containing protein n=1 Tax=Corynebacterium caspium TaxID=234828 RepID=UPI00037D7899|nr:DUF3710 domain-containing protein [Corynebacterium caspium]WKD59155.1 hypothetical protein CCASP_03755 [Corynebacterium caspium DSM 44850]